MKIIDNKTETIVHEFGRILELVSNEVVTKYPACVFPSSFLPYPKEKIQRALEDALRCVDDKKMRDTIKACLV